MLSGDCTSFNHKHSGYTPATAPPGFRTVRRGPRIARGAVGGVFMLSRVLFFLMVTFVTVRCEFKDVEVKPEAVPPVVQSFSDSTLTSLVIPLNDPDKYALDLSWQKTDLQTFIKLKTDYEFIQVSSDKFAYRFDLDGGSLYEVFIEWRNPNGDIIKSRTISGEIPKDFIVDGLQTLTESRKYSCGRIYLLKGAVLRVSNLNLEMNCTELISNEGIIETWAEGSVYPVPGNPGRAGGNIGIKVQRARGLVRVRLRGEAGANGRDGLKGHLNPPSVMSPGCKGQNGGQGGATGNFQIVAGETVKFEIIPEFFPGLPGSGGSGNGGGYEAIQNGGFHRNGENIPCEMTFRRESGANGSSGGRGTICQQVGPSPNKCI